MVDLVIFDFDGTLFQSPVPNKARLGSKVYGRLMSKSANGSGYGWFQDQITLSPKYTTEIGFGFIEHVKQAARVALDSPDTVCVLLTGRAEEFRTRVVELCNSVGLNFHGYYLKPDQVQSTGDFKVGVIDDLINTHKPDRVVMWEDRDKHIAVFESHLTNLGVLHNIVKVDYSGLYLDVTMESEIVDYLIAKNPIANINHRPNYYGVVLDDISVNLLKQKYTAPDGWVWRGHHMTIVVGNKYKARHDLVDFCDGNISQDVTLTVTGLAVSERNMAIRVESTPNVPTQNNVPHITIAHSIESKPRESNELINWVDVEPFILVGKISGVY